jgi:hypothetical protein
MKKIFIALLILSFHATFSVAEPSVDLTEIYKLTAAKEYEKALSSMQTYFEETRKTPYLSAVRLSFGLSTWASLGAVYPPALKALDDMSKKLQERVNAGKADSDEIHEYISINSYTNNNERTIKSFEIIDKQFPQQSSTFFIFAKNVIVSAKRDDLLKKYMTDPIADYEQIRSRRELDMSQSRKGKAYYSLEKTNTDFNKEVDELVSLTMSIGLNDEANEIKLRAADYMKHYATGKFVSKE